MQGYVYILTHPGTPCIFYDHLFSDGMRRANSVWGSLKRLLSGGSFKVRNSDHQSPRGLGSRFHMPERPTLCGSSSSTCFVTALRR